MPANRIRIADWLWACLQLAAHVAGMTVDEMAEKILSEWVSKQ